MVHMLPLVAGVVQNALQCATGLIDNIIAFKTNFAAEQPSGTPFPGYGIRFPGIGGWYGFLDYGGLIPNASHHPLDSLPQFVNGFTYTPSGRSGVVTTSGHTPTSTTFKIGGGDVFDRPNGGLVHNQVTFNADTVTVALRGFTAKVTGWSGNVATIDTPFPVGILPSTGDACTFGTLFPPGCYRFAEARTALLAWTEAFFDELDSNWPTGLEPPEFVASTVENFAEPDIEWHATRSFADYIAEDLSHADLLTDRLTLTEWLDIYGKDLAGSAIAIPGTSGPAFRSPQAQDRRSLAYGAFIVGLAWTWQLSFVNRMKRTWPRALFHQYQLHAGNRRSPIRNQPGEVFYHGEPWPPDVGHSHDEYNTILPYMFPSALARTATVDTGSSTTSVKVQIGSDFLSESGWGASDRDQMRFDPLTGTAALQNQPAAISAWNAGTRVLTCSTLPTAPASGDVFSGYLEVAGYDEWQTSDVGWAIWPAFSALYGHTGTLDERYRATCVSWVSEIAQRLTDAWPYRSVAPFVARTPEGLGPQFISDEKMYPEGALTTQPGVQTTDDWISMLTAMMDAGIPRVVVFEEHEERGDALDSWVEVFSGVREAYLNNLGRFRSIAPHPRNRDWRDRQHWRR